MKQDISIESNCSSERRNKLPRRRVATKATHEPGSFEKELSLAIKESLKYTENENELKLDSSAPILNGVQDARCKNVTNNFHVSSSNELNGLSQVHQLKDLLLIHIELIQHQQELLSSKDNEIRNLRNENSMAHCHLQKFEKRIALMKRREEALEAQLVHMHDSSAASPVDAKSLTCDLSGRMRLKINGSRCKRRLWLSGSTPGTTSKKLRKRTDTADGVLKSEQSMSEELVLLNSEHNDTDDDDGGGDVRGLCHKMIENSGDCGLDLKTNKMAMGQPGGTGVELGETGGADSDQVLKTGKQYHVACCVQSFDDAVNERQRTDVSIGDRVETPSWHVNVLSNRYQLEGTENITDEAYHKRHQKHEMEEKRRKRWDLQRIRERRALEKLAESDETKDVESRDQENLKTFLPSLDGLTHFEVVDTVVVSVFGQAVPNIQPSEFELPWVKHSSTITGRHGWRGRHK